MWTEKFKRSNKTPWQTLEGKALILQPDENLAHELNETATWFWTRFNGDKTLDGLLADFFFEYDQPENVNIRREIEEMVSTFKGQGLIE